MKKILIKPIVLILVFIGALFTFSIFTNQVNEDLTTTMSAATLPVMYFYNDTIPINELHGYVNEMDAVGMRDSITPLDPDRILPIKISTYGKPIDEIEYEIRSMNAERLVAEAEVSDYQLSDSEISTKIKIPNILENNEEYLMIFTLTSGEDKLYYYTRVMLTSNTGIKECLKFAMEFHDNTFDPDKKDFFPLYMDAATGDATNLAYVDLSCTVNQVMWGDFKAEPYTKPMVSIKEINNSYNVLTLSYILTNINGKGETEYYNVEEYFRLRNTDTRMYVLNYERTTEEIFRGENNFIRDDKFLNLGIRNENVEFKRNEAGNVVCFEQAGELWCLNQGSKEINQIFSFRDIEGMDIRDNWDQHDIKIVRIDEAGSVDFIVYGYMNRGDHEGQVGTAVYHYDGLAHTVEEEAFIPYLRSYEVLKADMGQLMFENDTETLFMMQEGNVYSLDLTSLKLKTEISGLKAGCYSVSESDQYLAWVDPQKEYSSTILNLLDFKTGKKTEISEGSKMYLRPLGFIDEDFIYGVASKSDVKIDAAGNTTFAMKKLKIMDTSENNDTILKEYKPKKGFIEGISINDYTITVNLIKKLSGQYISDGIDSIMNKDADTDELIAVSKAYADDKQNVVRISLAAGADAKKINMITSRGIILEEDRSVVIDSAYDQQRFYVYVKGDVILATDSISDAISCANERMGAVVDSSQQYVWMRARKTYSDPFSGIAPAKSDMSSSSIVKCVSAMLRFNNMDIGVSALVDKGATPKEILETTLKDTTVFDLTGCRAEDIIFYVSEGSPVFAMTGKNSAVLVTGYSATNVYYYDPVASATKSVSMEKANNMFFEGGNKFFAYLK